MKLVIATRNQHKLKEIKKILHNHIDVVSLEQYGPLPDIDEDQDTFIGNASKKALETARQINATVIADDSGLCVDALNGDPGVRSARYAGPDATYQDLCHKLLDNLKNIPDEKRTAHFITVIAVATPEKILFTCEGKADGMIIRELRGNQGFGYDPVFYYPPLQKTFAELSENEKNAVSHRARALQVLKEKLSDFNI
jgi:XTP/dITP diphosphohydrolase